jgi:hypothetical protein
MQFLLLIYGQESYWGTLSPEDQAKMYQEYGVLRQDLLDKKHYVGGNQLAPTTTATTVRLREGKKLVTDGPFAETKEHLGGYFLIEAKDLDEAIAIAARVPAARHGSIEVRPVVVRSQAQPA